MKKIYLSLISILCLSATVLAQLTLTQSNFVPAVGDSQLYYVADTNSILDNSTGPNAVFYYNNLRGYGQTQTQHFIDPTTTPNTGDYPTATFTDTTAGFAGNLKYNEDFTDSLNIIGLVLDINTFGIVIAKFDDDPEIFMKFPFNYGDSFTDSYGGTFTSPAAPLPTKGNGTATVTYDAWGTLKLPMIPDIDSVIRIVRVENLLTDTIFLQPFAPDILPIPVNATQVSYYKPSISKNPLLSFIVADVNGDTNINVVSQYPMFGVSVEEFTAENINLTLFPNPVNKDFTTLTFDLKNNANVNVTILNNLGQNVKEIFNGELQEGQNNLRVKTSNLSKGLYFVNISVNNKILTKKLIIE
jgi:Secretion system C-terminal sorting domain